MRNFSAELAGLESQGLRRRRRVNDCTQGARLRVDGREHLSFCSNDYLALAADPRVIAAPCEGAQRHGAGAGASHLVSGHHRAHEELEHRLAGFVRLPRALLFSSGYLAKLAVVTTLAGRSSEVFADKLNHASLNDAIVSSRACLRTSASTRLVSPTLVRWARQPACAARSWRGVWS